jgi:hypothetical protein
MSAMSSRKIKEDEDIAAKSGPLRNNKDFNLLWVVKFGLLLSIRDCTDLVVTSTSIWKQISQ